MHLLADAGPLAALLNRDDPHHQRTSAWFATAPRPLPVVEVVLAEAAYLLDRETGPSGELAVARLLADGELHAVGAETADWPRVAALVEQYLDLPLGLVDATVVAIAERLDIRTIATLDRRHFGVVRPRHVEAFELVP